MLRVQSFWLFGNLKVQLFLLIILSACAQIPKESVELSTTVGRDIATVHQSHRELANALFSRMKQDVNRFVDDVYAPYQIQYVLNKQKERSDAGNQDNIFSVLDMAMKEPGNAQAQKDVVLVMQAMVEAVHADVEDYRKIRLEPILQQEREVTAEIERAYDQIERGNAVVTAHLASIVRVHEAQDELLQAADLGGLREKIGVTLSETSDKIANFVDTSKKVEGSIDNVSETIQKLTSELDNLVKGGD